MSHGFLYGVFSPFTSSAQPKETHLKNPKRTGELLTALKNLGPVPAKAGKFGVLRVLASLSATPDAPTLSEAVQKDPNEHPGATLNMTSKALNQPVADSLQWLQEQVIRVAAERKENKSVPKDIMMEDERVSQGKENEMEVEVDEDEDEDEDVDMDEDEDEDVDGDEDERMSGIENLSDYTVLSK
jgi:hypothetical protein